MARTIVEITEAFVCETQLGALVSRSPETGLETEIAPARIHRTEYTLGQRLSFKSKKDARAFIVVNGCKARILEGVL